MFRIHLHKSYASNFGNTGSWLVVWKLKSRLVSVKHSEDILQANPREHPVRWRSKVPYFASEATSRKCWALQDYTFLGVCLASFLANSGARQPRWASKKTMLLSDSNRSGPWTEGLLNLCRLDPGLSPKHSLFVSGQFVDRSVLMFHASSRKTSIMFRTFVLTFLSRSPSRCLILSNDEDWTDLYYGYMYMYICRITKYPKPKTNYTLFNPGPDLSFVQVSANDIYPTRLSPVWDDCGRSRSFSGCLAVLQRAESRLIPCDCIAE